MCGSRTNKETISACWLRNKMRCQLINYLKSKLKYIHCNCNIRLSSTWLPDNENAPSWVSQTMHMLHVCPYLCGISEITLLEHMRNPARSFHGISISTLMIVGCFIRRRQYSWRQHSPNLFLRRGRPPTLVRILSPMVVSCYFRCQIRSIIFSLANVTTNPELIYLQPWPGHLTGHRLPSNATTATSQPFDDHQARNAIRMGFFYIA